MIYLSGHSSDSLVNLCHEQIGILVQPRSGYRDHLTTIPYWAADNGCYAQGDAFDVSAFLAWLDSLPRERCLFAVAPDVLGDAQQTRDRALPVLPIIRALGFPAALVAQDGFEDIHVSWDSLDALFIGGTTAWKESCTVLDVIEEAKTRGKWVHMGRVNSYRRLRFADAIGCQSVDGTFLKFGPDVNRPRLLRMLERVHTQKDLFARCPGR